MTIWAFNKADDDEVREMIYKSVKAGKSRFGWSQKDEHNLNLRDNWSDWHAKQLFLLQVQPGDWIVHINIPIRGRCIAAKAVKGYGFDDGLQCKWGPDFRHYFEVDTSSVVEFDRNDQNIHPSVNLNPRRRYQRIHAADEFLASIENLQQQTVNLREGQTREEYHLKEHTDKYLAEISQLIHQMYRRQNLERFIAKVLRRVPGIIDVDENGFGWGSDYGADLIVTMSMSVGNLQFERRIVVQVKSFEGSHKDTKAVDQVVQGIQRYGADAGMIFTTGVTSEELEACIQEAYTKFECEIDLIAGDDLARFVIRHAPDMLFDFEGLA